MAKRNIYNKRVEYATQQAERAKKPSLSANNRRLLLQFQSSLKARNSTIVRIGKLTYQLVTLIEFCKESPLIENSELNKLTKADIEVLIGCINDGSVQRFLISQRKKKKQACLVHPIKTEWNEATKADYRRALKQWHHWYKDDDNELYAGNPNRKRVYDYLEKKVTTSYKKPKIEFSELINEADIDLMIRKGCENDKEKAFMSLLLEGGFRIGELLNIRIKDVEMNHNKVWLTVDGKTGQRRTPIVKSMAYVARWLENHPLREEPDAYFFITRRVNGVYNPYMYIGARRLIKRVALKAGIKKRLNPHWFRKSSATISGQYMPESMLCKYYGWVIGSDEVRTYVHIGEKQLEQSISQRYGIKTEETNQDKVLTCVCGLPNPYTSKYCNRCGKPLSLEEAFKQEEESKVKIQGALAEYVEMLKDPKELKAFQEWLTYNQK